MDFFIPCHVYFCVLFVDSSYLSGLNDPACIPCLSSRPVWRSPFSSFSPLGDSLRALSLPSNNPMMYANEHPHRDEFRPQVLLLRDATPICINQLKRLLHIWVFTACRWHLVTRTAYTGCSPNAGLVLDQRLRRWSNTKPTLGECVYNILMRHQQYTHATFVS